MKRGTVVAARSNLNTAALRAFDATYDMTHEDLAFQVRGEFLRAFPKENLSRLSLDQYVIGHQRPTFCTYVEVTTRSWAIIQGSTASKFGIYFGKTKSDPRKIYRFTRKYGETKEEAFRAVKDAVLDLVRLGGQDNLDFAAIDGNPLSQMFKAKILSLYYPDRFLNVCSAEHLALLGVELGFVEDLPASEYQHLLLQAKMENPITKDWRNPKFMAFLYDTYVHAEREPASTVQKPRKKACRKVNFEDVQDQRDAIGKAAEDYALKWEQERLDGANLGHLIPKIEDRRDRPGYGYDFLSFSSAKQRRFIEVKSVGKLPGGEGHRFFLSDNEHSISKSAEQSDAYFFYLVFFDGNGEPADLQPILANDLYQLAEMTPASYVVRFDFKRRTREG
jgi:hypothetical protein